jgi:TetR/AcrR family transcriptional repressor of nem operon
MRSSREQAARNRETIIDAASRLFRERGFDDITVSEIMAAAGLTHGAFYGHFTSKADLIAEACQEELLRGNGFWNQLAQEREHPLKDIVDYYLCARHRDCRGTGCIYSALAADAGRQGGELKSVFTAGLKATFELLARLTEGSRTARRRRALAGMSQLVGAIILARAVDDEKLSQEILNAARSDLSER